jgi:cell division protein ZapA
MFMPEAESVKVDIFGKTYTLKGDADPEYVQEIAAFVDERMREVAGSAPTISISKVAILAAVNIADELFREQQKRLETMATLEDKSVQISHLLAKELGVDPSRDPEGDSLPGT